MPNVETAYAAKDPAHYHAFYATTAYPVSLMFDTSQYPFSLVPLPAGDQPVDQPGAGLEAR